MQPNKSRRLLLVAGVFEGAIEDTAWVVDKDSKPQIDSEETVMRMWVNAERTSCTKILPTQIAIIIWVWPRQRCTPQEKYSFFIYQHLSPY